MKLTAEPILNALHRGDSTIRFAFNPDDLAIERDGQKIVPASFVVDGNELVARYDDRPMLNDKLPS